MQRARSSPPPIPAPAKGVLWGSVGRRDGHCISPICYHMSSDHLLILSENPLFFCVHRKLIPKGPTPGDFTAAGTAESRSHYTMSLAVNTDVHGAQKDKQLADDGKAWLSSFKNAGHCVCMNMHECSCPPRLDLISGQCMLMHGRGPYGVSTC